MAILPWMSVAYTERAQLSPRPSSSFPTASAAAAVRRHRTVDRAARQRTARGTQHGAKRPVAAGIDRAAHQRAADTADQQAGRAVRMAAIGAAIPLIDARV